MEACRTQILRRRVSSLYIPRFEALIHIDHEIREMAIETLIRAVPTVIPAENCLKELSISANSLILECDQVVHHYTKICAINRRSAVATCLSCGRTHPSREWTTANRRLFNILHTPPSAQTLSTANACPKSHRSASNRPSHATEPSPTASARNNSNRPPCRATSTSDATTSATSATASHRTSRGTRICGSPVIRVMSVGRRHCHKARGPGRIQSRDLRLGALEDLVVGQEDLAGRWIGRVR
jgi:hypothetical protein